LAGHDQHRAPDGAEQAPGIEACELVAVVVSGDVRVPDHPGQEPAGLLGPARRGAVKRVADAGELSLEIPGVRGVTVPAVGADALDDGGRLGPADAAERLDDPRV